VNDDYKVTVEFTPSYSGIGRMLRSPMMLETMRRVAEGVKSHAVSIAPVSSDPSDTHQGRYKNSFGVRLGISRGRAEAVVFNDSREAVFVEKGTANMDGQHILLRAIDFFRGGA
jgi:hypothetical protein